MIDNGREPEGFGLSPRVYGSSLQMKPTTFVLSYWLPLKETNPGLELGSPKPPSNTTQGYILQSSTRNHQKNVSEERPGDPARAREHCAAHSLDLRAACAVYRRDAGFATSEQQANYMQNIYSIPTDVRYDQKRALRAWEHPPLGWECRPQGGMKQACISFSEVQLSYTCR